MIRNNLTGFKIELKIRMCDLLQICVKIINFKTFNIRNIQMLFITKCTK